MCVHLLGIMVMALLLATSMMTSVAAMTATMVPQLLWFILFASTMMQQPLLASIIKYIEDGHVVHIEVVITMPQTICVWIHVVAVVHP